MSNKKNISTGEKPQAAVEPRAKKKKNFFNRLIDDTNCINEPIFFAIIAMAIFVIIVIADVIVLGWTPNSDVLSFLTTFVTAAVLGGGAKSATTVYYKKTEG